MEENNLKEGNLHQGNFNKGVFFGFILVFISIICYNTILNNLFKDDHDKIMELIEEKELLIEIQDKLESKKTMEWCDSMEIEIDKKIKEIENERK